MRDSRGRYLLLSFPTPARPDTIRLPISDRYCCLRYIAPQHGPCFSFIMFGTEVTYLLGSEASANFWGSHNDHLNAEDLYANITVP